MKYNVKIPCAEKDYIKVAFCVERIQKYLNPQPENIYIISKDKIRIPGTTWIDESIAVLFSKANFRCNRPAWNFQQYIKLYTPSKLPYLCVDSDVFFNTKMDVFDEEGRTNLFISDVQQNHKPYFNFMKKNFLLEKAYDKSFICDFMMMHPEILAEFLPEDRMFIDMVNETDEVNTLLGDYEIVGTYYWTHHRDKFNLKPFTMKQLGTYVSQGPMDQKEIQEILDAYSEDVITIHSWT